MEEESERKDQISATAFLPATYMTYEDLVEAGLPEGFKWFKGKTCLAHDYKRTLDRASFKAEKQKTLDTLLEWCARLPEMRYKFHGRERAHAPERYDSTSTLK